MSQSRKMIRRAVALSTKQATQEKATQRANTQLASTKGEVRKFFVQTIKQLRKEGVKIFERGTVIEAFGEVVELKGNTYTRVQVNISRALSDIRNASDKRTPAQKERERLNNATVKSLAKELKRIATQRKTLLTQAEQLQARAAKLTQLMAKKAKEEKAAKAAK